MNLIITNSVLSYCLHLHSLQKYQRGGITVILLDIALNLFCMTKDACDIMFSKITTSLHKSLHGILI